MRLLGAVVALAAALALAPPAGALQGATPIERAAAALKTDPVYVDPAAERRISPADADRIRAAITAHADGPTYVAILPRSAADAAGGDSGEALRQLAQDVGRRGVYAAVVGTVLRAGATGGTGLAAGEAPRLATDALYARRRAGVTATLADFVERIGRARASGASGGGTGSTGTGGGGLLLGVLALAGAGLGLVALRNRRRRRREEQAAAQDLRRVADEDLVALGDDIRALDVDVEMPGADRRAKDDYDRAVELFERANVRLDRARTPHDFAPVSEALEEGRFAMESAKARLAGRTPPERRAPCFFDPRHGPSARDVEWAPDGGAARLVPACEADARRVERGEEPHTRELELAGRRTPWYHAPAYFGPYGGGFFGGFGGGGLITGLLAGSMLGGAFSGPGPMYGDPLGGLGGDWGGGSGDGGWGGGDFGGGDFGGGDFGGGDFGGGDFGGGGDF